MYNIVPIYSAMTDVRHVCLACAHVKGCRPLARQILKIQHSAIGVRQCASEATDLWQLAHSQKHTHTRLERINRVIRRELNPIHARPEKNSDLKEPSEMYPSE